MPEAAGLSGAVTGDPLSVSGGLRDWTVMRSGYRTRRSSLRRRAPAMRTPSVFCCNSSSAVREERYLSVRTSCHR